MNMFLILGLTTLALIGIIILLVWMMKKSVDRNTYFYDGKYYLSLTRGMIIQRSNQVAVPAIFYRELGDDKHIFYARTEADFEQKFIPIERLNWDETQDKK